MNISWNPCVNISRGWGQFCKFCGLWCICSHCFNYSSDLGWRKGVWWARFSQLCSVEPMLFWERRDMAHKKIGPFTPPRVICHCRFGHSNCKPFNSPNGENIPIHCNLRNWFQIYPLMFTCCYWLHLLVSLCYWFKIHETILKGDWFILSHSSRDCNPWFIDQFFLVLMWSSTTWWEHVIEVSHLMAVKKWEHICMSKGPTELERKEFRKDQVPSIPPVIFRHKHTHTCTCQGFSSHCCMHHAISNFYQLLWFHPLLLPF